MNLDISFDELRNHINECIDYELHEDDNPWHQDKQLRRLYGARDFIDEVEDRDKLMDEIRKRIRERSSAMYVLPWFDDYIRILLSDDLQAIDFGQPPKKEYADISAWF